MLDAVQNAYATIHILKNFGLHKQQRMHIDQTGGIGLPKAYYGIERIMQGPGERGLDGIVHRQFFREAKGLRG